MTRKWIAINIVLLAVVGLLGWQLTRSVKQFREANDPAQFVPAEDPKKLMAGAGELPPLRDRMLYDPMEYQTIPAQNLFSEARGPEAAAEVPVVVESPTMSAKPVLVGVTLWGSERVASIVDPTSQGGNRRRVQSKRVGDTYQGYTITDITADRIILEAGGQREVIPLHDASKRPVQAGKTPIVATRVVSFGGGGSTIGGAVARPVVVAGSGEPARSMPQPGTVMSPTQAAAGAGRQQPAAVVQTAPQAAAEAPRPGELRDAQGRRIIRTPFGDIVRPDPPMH